MDTRKFTLSALIAIVIVSLWVPQPVLAATAPAEAQVQALVLLTASHDAQQLAQVQASIQADGGRILHTLPAKALIAQLPNASLQQLASLPGVAAISTQAVDLSTLEQYGAQARNFVSAWNDLAAPRPSASTGDLRTQAQPVDRQDAFTAPDSLMVGAKSVAAAPSVRPGYYQTSEYMAGSVAVGLVLVESNGSVDASAEDWTSDQKQLVLNKVVAALNWWARLEPRARLSFVYDDHVTVPLPTSVEPITRPQSDEKLWIADAMSALGYDAASYFTRVRDYNNALRAQYHTDWAFTIFVVNSAHDDDSRFSDGYFAYAYVGGPFMVMTYGNSGYGAGNMDAVAAHEIGHIFNALDQYVSAGQSCASRSGYLAIENQNSQAGGCAMNVESIMRGQVSPYLRNAIDPFAAGQIGWRASNSDNILDPLYTNLPITITAFYQSNNTVTVSGTVQVTPYPSPSRSSVTINTLTGAQYRLDEGEWQPASADDGAFDGTVESYHFTAGGITPGVHTLQVAATDSGGNISKLLATRTIAVLDPVDGGLITMLESPKQEIHAGNRFDLTGVAYQLDGGAVVNVQYRVNGGAWQTTLPQDGKFDSSAEPFTITMDTLDIGTYLLEARATDAAGKIETTCASQPITITRQMYTAFLPFVIR